MSKARTEYEAALDAAVAVLGDDCRQAYAAFDQSAQSAWYDYQVKTGMIPVPRGDQDGKENDHDEGDRVPGNGTAGNSASDGEAGGKRAVHPLEDDQVSTEARGGDAITSPDSG